MNTLQHKIARVLIRDVFWMALLFLVIQGKIAGRLTIRDGVYVAGLLLVLYSIFQLALCGRAYLTSYRDALAVSLREPGTHN
jgi:hypothetical protein